MNNLKRFAATKHKVKKTSPKIQADELNVSNSLNLQEFGKKMD